MRRWLSTWNLLGALVFLLGALFYLRSGQETLSKPLPLPPALEARAPKRVAVNLYLPTPPQGFMKKMEEVQLALGEEAYQKALELWLKETGKTLSLQVFRRGEGFVVNLQTPPRDLDVEGEVFLLYGLAYTLLYTFPEGKSVRFLVDGQPSLGFAHLDLSEPISLP
ncbi:MAG: spore gernimation protein [Thermus sp.]|uniref:GerMN domain-containing protein n=1 Tax=Thermus sp. TaxID=275 RepID=UPI00332CE0BC